MIGALLYKLGAYLALRLPQKLSLRITQFLADIYCFFSFKIRRTVCDNLRIIHGGKLSEKAIRERTHQVFRSFAKSIYLFLRLPQLRIDELETVGDAAEFEKLAEDLTSKGGFVIITAHLGPWEVGGVWLAARGLIVNTVALDHPAEAVTAFFNKRRELSGLRIFPPRNSFSMLKNALDHGECVALLVDRNCGGASKHCRWFGHEKDLPIGHILLSIRSRVPVVTGAFVFGSGSDFRVVVGGVHHPDPTVSEDEAIDRLLVPCIQDLEALVKAHSEQWFQFTPLEPKKTL